MAYTSNCSCGRLKRRREARRTATVLVFHSRLEIYCDIPCRRMRWRRRKFTVYLWTISRSHRVHLFKNQKHLTFLYHHFSCKNVQKKNHKKNVWVVHLEAEMSVLWLPSSRPARPRSCGDAVNLAGFCLWTSSLKVAPVPISEGTEQGPSVSAETVGWAPQFWYQVLGKKKKKKLLGLALFQSRFRLASFNKTITIACVVVFSFCLGFIVRRGQKLLFTPHWT